MSKFLESICQRLGVAIGTKELAGIHSVIESGEDRDILRKLRNETTHLVLLVRLRNEERKEQFAAEREGEAAQCRL